MNDFTKEELIALQQSFKDGCKAFSNDEFDAALELKLESLIDNYCEHEWQSGVINAIYCTHCQMAIKSIFSTPEFKNDNQ